MQGQITIRDLVEKHCELGLQKTCTRCGESWPADGEFFRERIKYGRPYLERWCRACASEVASENRRRRQAA